MKNITKKLRKIIGIGAIALATLIPTSAKAQSVFNGLRGPTKFQVDNRISYSTMGSQIGAKTEALANNLILKYWNGTDNGVFAFVNLPYKSIESGGNESKGIWDLSLGMGPRFQRNIGENKLGFLTYIGAVLPTGDNETIPALGTGRVDYQAGLFGTLLSGSKKYEADFSLNYTLTEGEAISDNISGGLVLGGRINDNLRLVAGPVFNYKTGGNNDGDNTLSGRINLRYTPSGNLGKRMHFELWYDKLIESRGISSARDSDALTLVARLNF